MSDTNSKLAHFPISFFAAVMGLLGLTLAVEKAESVYGAHMGVAWSLLLISGAVFVVIAFAYLLKAMLHPQAVAAEWMHPVRIAFFPAISISFLLAATAIMGVHEGLARILFLIGAAGQLVLTLSVVANWIGSRAFLHTTLSPAWFIPAVGNVFVPLAGTWLGYIELSWFFFSAGIVFWIVLLTLVMNRLVFHDPLPGLLQPTLVILIAPPAVGFVAYVALTGALDPFARILMNTAYLFALIVITQLPKFSRLPFAMSFWALSFPLAALSVASFRYAELVDAEIFNWIGLASLYVLFAVIVVLVLRTLGGLLNGTLLQPE